MKPRPPLFIYTYTRKKLPVFFALVGFSSSLYMTSWRAFSAISPEQRTLEISKMLRPIPDDQWAQIAGNKISEQYGIVTGDTLYDISKRLFGDAKYWPKVWALNNGNITNPHLIMPGNAIAFTPGSGTSLPSVTIAQNTASDPGLIGRNTQVINEITSSPLGAGRSQEWKKLPPQNWDVVKVQVPVEVDPLGFDRRNVIVFKRSEGFQLPAICASGYLPVLGKIVAGEKPGVNLGLTDVVFIDSETENLEVGKMYSVTNEPSILQGVHDTDLRLSYINEGTIKILGKKDSQYIGEVSEGMDSIKRGHTLIPLIPRFPEPVYIAAPEAKEGVLLVDPMIMSTKTVIQGRMAYVDLGSSDGIKPGMIFRVYLHHDPETGELISGLNYIVAADLAVVQVSPRISSLIVVGGEMPVENGTELVLMTDVSDIGVRKYGRSEQNIGTKPEPSGVPSSQPVPSPMPSALPSAAPSGMPSGVPSGMPSPTSTAPGDELPPPPPPDETSVPTAPENPAPAPSAATPNAAPSAAAVAPPPPPPEADSLAAPPPPPPDLSPAPAPAAPKPAVTVAPPAPPPPAAAVVPPPPPADDLDQLNKAGSLTPEQEKDLKQLEKTSGVPSAPPPLPAPVPTGDMIPPPPP